MITLCNFAFILLNYAKFERLPDNGNFVPIYFICNVTLKYLPDCWKFFKMNEQAPSFVHLRL